MNWATVAKITELPEDERKSKEVSDLVLIQSKIEKKRQDTLARQATTGVKLNDGSSENLIAPKTSAERMQEKITDNMNQQMSGLFKLLKNLQSDMQDIKKDQLDLKEQNSRFEMSIAEIKADFR